MTTLSDSIIPCASCQKKDCEHWSRIATYDVKDFFKEKVEKIIEKHCKGTSANCYNIIKEIREELGEKLIG